MRKLHADRGRQAVAPRAEPAAGHPAVWLLELEELRRPHLMLADFGRDVDVAVLGPMVEPLDRVLRLDRLIRWPVRKAIARAPFVDLLPPARQCGLVDLLAALL